MSAEHDAAIRSKLRAAAEELIDERYERLLQHVERFLTRGGKIDVRYLSGPIPPNLHSPVDERSVIVAHPTFSTAVDLATLLDQIIARFAFSYAELLIGGQPGDIIDYDADGRGQRLGIGDDGQVLTVDTGFPVWADATDTTPAASDTVAGKVELATTAETTTGTDATRAVTPDGLHDMTSLAGAAWFLDEDAMGSNSDTKTASQQSIKAYVDAQVAGGGYTNEQAQDAVGGALTDSSSIDFTYNDGANTITAVIIDEYVYDLVQAMFVDGTGIDFTISDAGNSITAEPIFAGTGSAGTVAHSDHTHSGTTITVQEGDSTVDAAVTTLDFDASDFNVTSSPSGEANISLAYGTSSGTPAEGDHTHAASANPLLTVREAQLLKSAGVTLHGLGLAGFAVQNGTGSDQDDAEGPWIGANSGTATGNTGQIFGGNTDCRADWLPDITFVIKTDPTAITASRVVVGPSNANPTAASLATSHHALFFYDTDIHGTAFWRVSNNNGGTPTQTTTSVAIAANTKYVLRVVFSGSDIKYYINGTLAATHSTTMPTTAALSHYIRAENRSAGGAGTNRMVKLGRIAQLTSL